MRIPLASNNSKLQWKVFQRAKSWRRWHISDKNNKGRFNAPLSIDVGLVIVGQEFEPREVNFVGRIYELNGIGATHRSYDVLQYPIISCRGKGGWAYPINIPQRDPNTKAPLDKNGSATDCYSHHKTERENQIN